MKKGGRLASVSVKRRAANAQLAESRAIVVDRSYGRCEANTPACPDREHAAEHVHHIKQRSAGGGHSVDNLLAVCAKAHEHIHNHPQESVAAGWLIPSWVNNGKA